MVVGGGIAGLSVAWALARRGLHVDLFEQGALPNPLSSSYDEHRIIRHAYGPLSGYARMMPAAYRVWDSMWEDFGVSHFEDCGTIYATRNEDGWFETSMESLDELGIPYIEISPTVLGENFPMVEPRGIRRAMRAENSGILYPQRILTDLLTSLIRLGVSLQSGTQVSEIDPERTTLTVKGQTKAADVVVIAAGAWVARLLPQLREIAVPSRQTVLYLAPPASVLAAWKRAPPLLIRNYDVNLYSLPPRIGTRLKIGDHRYSRSGDVDTPRQPSDADVQSLWNGIRTSFRFADRYTLLESKACFYTVTDDQRFYVRQIGGRMWGMSACSGHGFKLAPLIAEGLAQAIVGETDAAGITDWAAGRSC